MNNREFSDNFDVLLNSYDSKAPFGDEASKQEISLNEYEKSVFLSMAEEDVVKSYFDKTLNQQAQGFDDTPRRQVDYGSLIKVANISPIEINENGSVNYETVVNPPIGSSTGNSSGMSYNPGTDAIAVVTGNAPTPEKFYNWTKELSYNYYVTKTHAIDDRGVDADVLIFNKDGGTQIIPTPYYWGSGYKASYSCDSSWISIEVLRTNLYPYSRGTIVCQPNPSTENRTAKITVGIFDNWTGTTVFREVKILQVGGTNTAHYLSNQFEVEVPGENYTRYFMSLYNYSDSPSFMQYGYVTTSKSNKIYILFSDGKSVLEHYHNGDISYELHSDKYYKDKYPTNNRMVKGLFYVDNPSDETPTWFNVSVVEDGLIILTGENTNSSALRGCLSVHIENGSDIADYDILVIKDFLSPDKGPTASSGDRLVLPYESSGGVETVCEGYGLISAQSSAQYNRHVYFCVLPLKSDLPDWVHVTIDNLHPEYPERIPVTVECDPNYSATMRWCNVKLITWIRDTSVFGPFDIKAKPIVLRIYQAGTEQSVDIKSDYIKSITPDKIIFPSTVIEAIDNETLVQKIYLDTNSRVTHIGAFPDPNSRSWYDVSNFDYNDKSITVTLTGDNPNSTERPGYISIVARDEYGYNTSSSVNIVQLPKKRQQIEDPDTYLAVNPHTVEFDASGICLDNYEKRKVFKSLHLPPPTPQNSTESWVRWNDGKVPTMRYLDNKVVDWIHFGTTTDGYYIECDPITDPLVDSRTGSIQFGIERYHSNTTEYQEVVVTQRKVTNRKPVIIVHPLQEEGCSGIGFGPDGGEQLLNVTVLYTDDFSIDIPDGFPFDKFGIERDNNIIKVTCTEFTGNIEDCIILNASNNNGSADPVYVDIGQFQSYEYIPEDYYVVEYEDPILNITTVPSKVLLPSRKTTAQNKTVNVYFSAGPNVPLPDIIDVDVPSWLVYSFNNDHTILTITTQDNPSTSERQYTLHFRLSDGGLHPAECSLEVVQCACPTFDSHQEILNFDAINAEEQRIPFTYGGAVDESPGFTEYPWWLNFNYFNGVLSVRPDDNFSGARSCKLRIRIRNNYTPYPETEETLITINQSAKISEEVITPGSTDYPVVNPDDSGGSGTDSGGDSGGGDTDDDLIPDGGIFDDRSFLFRLPRRIVNNVAKKGTTDVLFILNEKLITKKNNSTGTFTIRPMSFTEYDRMMSKAYTSPMKRQAWRLFQNQNTGFDIFSEIIPPNNAQDCDSCTYRLRYVRRPKPIILENLPDGLSIDGYSTEMECELNPILHQDILARAVQLALASKGRQTNSTEKQ